MNKRNILALATTIALAASTTLLFTDAAHAFGGHGGGGWAHGGGGGWGHGGRHYSYYEHPRYYSGRSSYSSCYRWSPRRGGWVNVCARPYYDW